MSGDMFSIKPGFLALFAIIAICESLFLDSLSKCSIYDAQCQKNLFQVVLQDISKSGIKELGIPPIDPIELKNVSVSIMGLIDLTMEDGIATGVKNCMFNELSTEIEKGHSSMDITCDIVVKGHYTASSNSPVVKSFLGSSSIHGDGFAKIKIDKLNLKIDYEYDIVRGEGGEIFFKCKHNNTLYTYDVLGKTLFHVDHLFVGGQDMSQFVTDFLNQNGKYVMKTFGGPFMDKAMEFFYIFTHRFFDVVPIKYYISDDLTPYLKN